MNKADVTDENIDIMINALVQHKEDNKTTYKQSLFSDIAILSGSREHFRSLIAVVGLWVYAAFNYYLIGYYIKYFPGDVFFNFLMMTVAEVLAPIYLYMVQGKYVSKHVA